ncbi:hypothetical protein QVD17_04759 [Tagetes erecta]|uniref:RING-type E3 ubiquitin transferase n=1 Tax=Tagetes erecta TaxID=13708 RepID=A0AAD8PAX4_TARER|nr:hypothetical protein QVD17_04759 [Tagetes erecta]
MADTSKPHLKPDASQHQLQHQPISSQQNLDNCVEDDDIVNVDDEDVPYIFNPFSPLNSPFFAPSSSSPYHHDYRNHQVNSNSCSETESDCADSTVYPDCLYDHDDEYDQMDFITDLFDSRGETEHVSSRFSCTDLGSNDNHGDFVSNNIEELGLGHEGVGGGGGGGLRVARIESESDTEDLGEVVEQNDDITQSIDLNLEHVWDCPAFDTTDRVDERDGLSSVIDRIEETSVSSDGEATVGVLEWEILLAVNNLERDIEIATDGVEGFVYTPEFDTLIGQFVETVRALRGSPPAAKAIVDNLPLVVLKIEDAEEDDNVVCAVCKDEISTVEKVTQLPCKHHYHGECIIPWLSIRNTCPVCRFELPTDDVDYERSKNMVDADELRVGYGLDLSP